MIEMRPDQDIRILQCGSVPSTIPTTLCVICSEITSNVLSIFTVTFAARDIGAMGSPFSAFARMSAKDTGLPLKSVSKNVSSPVKLGVTIESTRWTVVMSAVCAPRAPPQDSPAPRPPLPLRACCA